MRKIVIVLLLVVYLCSCSKEIKPDYHKDAWIDLLFEDTLCEIPCFLGIEPGVTDWQTAKRILDTQEQIKAYSNTKNFNFEADNRVFFDFRTNHINKRSDSGSLWIKPNDNLVQKISLTFTASDIQVGEIISSYGAPDYYLNEGGKAPPSYCNISLIYLKLNTVIGVKPKCKFLDESTKIEIDKDDKVYFIIAYHEQEFDDLILATQEELIDWSQIEYGL